MIGSSATAVEDFTRRNAEYHGTIRIRGEFWNAVSHENIHAGQNVEVDDLQGLTLGVSPRSDQDPADRREARETN